MDTAHVDEKYRLSPEKQAQLEARKAMLLRQAARLAAERDAGWLIRLLRKLRG